jgi:outer membrane immunogenic protein
MRKALRFCALVAAIIVPGAAHAADLRPILKRSAPPAVAPIYNWNGFYVGAHAGASWADNKFFDLIGGIEVAKFQAQGYLVGGQFGYNWQKGSWVLGAEFEGSYSHLQRGVGFPGGGLGGCGGGFQGFGGFGNQFGQFGGCAFGGGFGLGFGQFGARVQALGLLSGRLGYAWDRALFYVKAGGALANEKYVFQIPGVSLSVTPTDTRLGWLVGAGVEYGLTANWSVKLEYNYIDLGTERLNPTSPAGLTFVFDQSQKVQVAKGGVNYRF